MQTLFLLCGLLCDEAVWADVPTRLADIADVHIVSFPGCNSIGDMARRVLASAPPAFALAGHSMGGRVALEVWRRAPQRITRLGLLNTGVQPARPAEQASRGLLVQLARTRGMAALADEWLPPLMGASASRVAEVMPALRAMVERPTCLRARSAPCCNVPMPGRCCRPSTCPPCCCPAPTTPGRRWHSTRTCDGRLRTRRWSKSAVRVTWRPSSGRDPWPAPSADGLRRPELAARSGSGRDADQVRVVHIGGVDARTDRMRLHPLRLV